MQCVQEQYSPIQFRVVNVNVHFYSTIQYIYTVQFSPFTQFNCMSYFFTVWRINARENRASFYCLKHLLLEQCYFLLLGASFIRTVLLFTAWIFFYQNSATFYCLDHLLLEQCYLLLLRASFIRTVLLFTAWIIFYQISATCYCLEHLLLEQCYFLQLG